MKKYPFFHAVYNFGPINTVSEGIALILVLVEYIIPKFIYSQGSPRVSATSTTHKKKPALWCKNDLVQGGTRKVNQLPPNTKEQLTLMYLSKAMLDFCLVKSGVLPAIYSAFSR